MYRDLDENNKSQLRERVDMSMRSPTNNWIDESIQKINTQKKSLSTERKVAGSSSVSQSNNTSIGDLSKIFKPLSSLFHLWLQVFSRQATSQDLMASIF
jgi:hypothetical protein